MPLQILKKSNITIGLKPEFISLSDWTVKSLVPFCENCGTQYPVGQRFCHNCGVTLVQGKEQQITPTAQKIEPKPKSRSLLKRLGIVAVVIIVALFVAVLLGVLYVILRLIM